MADITVNKATRDGVTQCTLATGTASQTFVFDTQDEKTAIVITNSASSAATVTVKAGNGIRSSIGDLEATIAANSTGIVGPLDSMRFKDMSTGKVTINISGGTTSLNVIAL